MSSFISQTAGDRRKLFLHWFIELQHHYLPTLMCWNSLHKHAQGDLQPFTLQSGQSIRLSVAPSCPGESAGVTRIPQWQLWQKWIFRSEADVHLSSFSQKRNLASSVHTKQHDSQEDKNRFQNSSADHGTLLTGYNRFIWNNPVLLTPQQLVLLRSGVKKELHLYFLLSSKVSSVQSYKVLFTFLHI